MWTCSGMGASASALPAIIARCSHPSPVSRKPTTRNVPATVGIAVSAERTTCGSVRRRYAAISAIETNGSRWRSANEASSFGVRHRGRVLLRDNLTQHARRPPHAQAGQVDRSLGGTWRRPQHPVPSGLHRDHVTGPAEIGRRGVGRGQGSDGPGHDRSTRSRCPSRGNQRRPDGWPCRRVHRPGDTPAAGSVAHIPNPAERPGRSPRCAGR